MNYKHVIAFLATKQQKNWRTLPDEQVQGYENYTIEVLENLENKYKAGEIKSRPIKEYSSVVWHDRLNRRHRPNNLPAIETEDRNVTDYYVNGNLHRTDGPATACIAGEKIEWYLNGQEVFAQKVDGRDFATWISSSHSPDVSGWAYSKASSEKDVLENIEKYKELVVANFPDAGAKIWIWDYIPSLASNPVVTEFRKKYGV